MTRDEFWRRLGAKVRKVPAAQLRREARELLGDPAAKANAYYRPATDTVTLSTEPGDVEVELHEAVHWSGREGRAGARPATSSDPTNPVTTFLIRSVEEVIAEAGAEALSADLFGQDFHRKAQAYIRSWVEGSHMPKAVEEAARAEGLRAAKWIEGRVT